MNKKLIPVLFTALTLLAAGCAPAAPGTGQATPGQTTPGQSGGGQAGAASPGGGAGGGQGGWQGGAGGAPGAAGRQGRQTTVTVQVETARFGDLKAENTTAGAVIPEIQSAVAAGASGTVKTILRQAGDWVEAGTPVVLLDDAQLKLSLRLAQTTLENAKINAGVADGTAGGTSKLTLQLSSAQSAVASAQKNYASAQALAKVGGISGSDLDNALTQLQTAQANLESAKMSVQQGSLQVDTAAIQLQQAQLNLANATIKAPYSGQISAVNLHPGEYVGANTAAFSLVSRSKVISFGVSPSDAPGLTLGTKVQFTYGGKSQETLVTQAPSAPVNGLVPLTAALPPAVGAPLGTVGTLTYQLILAQGTIVALPALQSAENKTFVYVADQGKARRLEVTVLGESGTYAAVSGVSPGATVILNPPPGLLVGTPVQTVAAAGQGTAAGAGQRRPGAGSAAGTAPAGEAAPAGQGPTPGQTPGGWTGQRRQGAGTAAPAAGEATGAPAGQAAGQGQSGWTGQRRQRPASDQAAPAAPAAPVGGN